MVSGSTAFLNATINSGRSAVGSARSSCQGTSVRPMYTPRLEATAHLRTPHVRAASNALNRPVVSVRKKSNRVLSGDAASEMDDVTDVVTIAEGEECVPVGDVEGLHGDPAGQERRHLGPVVET